MESDMPIELLVCREWCGTKWHYPNIERMVEENKRLRAELAAAIKQRDGYRSALERIANEDYRGNRSNESQIAFDALAAADSALAAMRKGGGA